jgi:serine/threonine protein kinase
MPDSNPLQPGLKIGKGRFVLRKVLGQGGMGEVWLAQDERLDEPVALKFLPSAIRGDPVALDDLRRETARSHRLTFPNIVRIHDLHEEDDDVSFIAMEYVDGPTLALVRLQQPSRVVPWSSLRPLMEQLCAGLDYAHGERVIHRDLKPANMMVDSKGRLKLADFGIAATVSDSMSRISLRHATSGTLVYMSPQQLTGKRPHPADDIYALGATLYELLTSKPPFYSGDLPHQVLYEPPEPLDERLAAMGIQNEVPSDVSALIMACLAKDPAQRPQSARAVAQWIGIETTPRPTVEALGEALFPGGENPEPIAQPTIQIDLPPQFPENPEEQTNKRLTAVSIGLTIALICAAVVAVMVWQKRRAATQNTGGATNSLSTAAGAKSNKESSVEPPLSDLSLAAAMASVPSQTIEPAGRLKGGVPNGGKPWTNTLGMRFVPVPGTRVLFSIWDTRVQDFQAFATARNRTWLKPGFPQDGTHPAVNVSWDDARMFCVWLTRKEKAEGFLKPNEFYRLPSDREWSIASGLSSETPVTPAERGKEGKDAYPWGHSWPPPVGVGNFADETLLKRRNNAKVIDGYTDGFVETSPVGHFTPNAFGLYDMSGNVWQWVEDWYDDTLKTRTLRGGSWQAGNRFVLRTAYRNALAPDTGNGATGFRCVIAPLERDTSK